MDCVRNLPKEQRQCEYCNVWGCGFNAPGPEEFAPRRSFDESFRLGRTFSGLIPAWMNAPSTLQPGHEYHGKNFVIVRYKDGGYRACCIDDATPRTMDFPANTPFEPLWNNKRK